MGAGLASSALLDKNRNLSFLDSKSSDSRPGSPIAQDMVKPMDAPVLNASPELSSNPNEDENVSVEEAEEGQSPS